MKTHLSCGPDERPGRDEACVIGSLGTDRTIAGELILANFREVKEARVSLSMSVFRTGKPHLTLCLYLEFT
jgi:hypothetical protein